ncbi:growth hormone secretagogue receptor type 1-like [Ptychodera flava]|uniref:growth hormone secretagogue receptor type 1-like n=1 Tax=Ptychodera flava TaxID=63121 RepID=UPI003969DA87
MASGATDLRLLFLKQKERTTIMSSYPPALENCTGNGTLENCTMAAGFLPVIPVLPSPTLIVTTIAYVIIFILGVVGNAMVAFVVWKNNDMRSSTNYFLVNLSIADLLVLIICMPTALLETYVISPFLLGEVMCKLSPFLERTAAHASVLTLVAVAIERYYAICHPLKAQYKCTPGKTIKICFLIWIMASLSTVPNIMSTVHEPRPDGRGNIVYDCRTYTRNKASKIYMMFAIPVIFFALPMFLLSVLYCLIIRTLNYANPTLKSENSMAITKTSGTAGLARHKANYKLTTSRQALNKHAHSPTSEKEENMQEQKLLANSAAVASERARRRVVYMLLTVVTLFFLCLLPERVVNLYFSFASDEELSDMGVMGQLSIVIFCRVMFYLNSAVNPAVYNIASTKFRTAFLHAVGIRKRKLGRSGTVLTTVSRSSLRMSQRSISTVSKWTKRPDLERKRKKRRMFRYKHSSMIALRLFKVERESWVTCPSPQG